MSWLVEQSDDSSAVHVDGNTVTCSKEGYYGSPINVLYKDAASTNGNYFWEFHVEEADKQAGNCISIGLTTEAAFKSGWALRAMKYLGNLSDGSSLLVSEFGDIISQADKVGLLLNLSASSLKLYIYHNDRPLGLAFNVQSPYPKPLFPVIGFSANGKISVVRSSSIPSSVDRAAPAYQGIEGNWKIVECSRNPSLVDLELNIQPNEGSSNSYRLHTRVVNSMNAQLEYNGSSGQCRVSPMMSTLMMGPADLMNKEQATTDFISGLTRINSDGQYLTLTTFNGAQARLQRFTVPPPDPVTTNIFA